MKSKMKLKLKQNIGMSIVDTVQKKIQLLNEKIEIEINYPKMKLKMKFKLKQNTGISVYIAVIDTE